MTVNCTAMPTMKPSTFIRVSEEVRITLERCHKRRDHRTTWPAHAGTAPVCQKCSTTMVLRTSKRGDTRGNGFWGCPSLSQVPQHVPSRPIPDRDL